MLIHSLSMAVWDGNYGRKKKQVVCFKYIEKM